MLSRPCLVNVFGAVLCFVMYLATSPPPPKEAHAKPYTHFHPRSWLAVGCLLTGPLRPATMRSRCVRSVTVTLCVPQRRAADV
eukprot:363666-Chlamydomonas_euryale.AAC.4